MKYCATIFTLMLASAPPLTASAGEAQLSFGGTYLTESGDADFSFALATVKGAYFFTDHFGVEAEGGIGVSGGDNFLNTGADFSLKHQLGLYAIGRLPVGKNGEFFGRVGARGGKFDVEYLNANFNADYHGFGGGGGYAHYFKDNFGIRGEVTVSDASLDGSLSPDGVYTSATVSMTYKFGSK